MSENLIPFDQRTEEEQRAIRQAGGRASGVARRRRRDLKELCLDILHTPIDDDETAEKLLKAGLEDTYGGLMLLRAIQKAHDNPQMFERVLALAGYNTNTAKLEQTIEDKTPEGIKLEFVSYDKDRLSPEDRAEMERLEAKCREVRT